MAWNNAKTDLSSAVRDLSIDEDIVIENPSGPGMRQGGRWIDPPAATAALTASVQPASGNSLELLPQGSRTQGAIEIWGTSEIRPLERAEGEPATIVRWKGATYRADVVEDWYEHGRYWFAVCTRVEQ